MWLNVESQSREITISQRFPCINNATQAGEFEFVKWLYKLEVYARIFFAKVIMMQFSLQDLLQRTFNLAKKEASHDEKLSEKNIQVANAIRRSQVAALP